jgi:hypothetical protein
LSFFFPEPCKQQTTKLEKCTFYILWLTSRSDSDAANPFEELFRVSFSEVIELSAVTELSAVIEPSSVIDLSSVNALSACSGCSGSPWPTRC